MMRQGLFLAFVFLLVLSVAEPVNAQACEPPVDTIRLLASVDLETPYVGEQLIYTIRIENTLENPPNFDPPPFEGFWRAGSLAITSYDEDICGVNVSITTGQYILFPLREGNITIPPGTLDFSRNPVFEARTRVESNEVAVNVLPVPASGVPDTFGGLVGYPFFIDATVGRTSARAGDPISLRVTVEGSGNIEQMSPPDLPLLENWRVYAQPADVETATDGNELVGRKTFEWLVVSTEAGTVNIPPIELSYFDNNTNIYRTISTEPIELNLLPADNIPAAEPLETSAEVEAGLLALYDVTQLRPPRNYDWLWLLWGVPPLIFIGSVWYRWNASRAEREKVRRRQSAALRTAKTNLSAVTRQRGDRAYKELILAVLTYFGDRWNTEPLALDHADIRDGMLEAGVDDDAVDSVMRCMQAAEEGRYAPEDSSPPRTLVKQTLMALVAVDGALGQQ